MLLFALIAPCWAWGGLGPLRPAEGREAVDRLAAVVEGQAVTLSELLWLIRYKRLQIPQDPEKRQEFLLQNLNQLIDEKLIAWEAERTPGIRISEDDIDAQIGSYRRSFESPRLFEEQLRSMEMNLVDLRGLIRRQLGVMRFLSLRFEPFIIVLPDEIESYYSLELAPRFSQEGKPVPDLSLVEEQIRQILTTIRTNQEMDRWIQERRRQASVSVLLNKSDAAPNLPGSLSSEIRLRRVENRP